MKELSYNMPGLLFPSISLLMLAYTNRFLSLASLARHLVDQKGATTDPSVQFQISNLRARIQIIRHAQAMGVLSLTLCTTSLFLLFMEWQLPAKTAFASALMFMLASLSLSLREIHLSARALDKALGKISDAKE